MSKTSFINLYIRLKLFSFMPRISTQKRDKIAEQILHYLFTVSPESKFTSEIAREIARDEEFTKTILLTLKSKNLVLEVNKNPEGILYSKRQRWSLSSAVYTEYLRRQ